MEPLYPIFLRLHEQPVLVIGGGAVGWRKAQGLLAVGALVTIVAPEMLPAIVPQPGLTLLRQPYASSLMAQQPSWRLVFLATDDPAVNAAAQGDAQALGLWCCRCDEPARGDFVGGATLQRPGLTLAVSTEGASPALAVRIRDAAAQLDPMLLTWSQLLHDWRPRVLQAVPDPAARHHLLRRLAGEEMEACLRTHGVDRAQATFEQWLGLLDAPSPQPTGATHAP